MIWDHFVTQQSPRSRSAEVVIDKVRRIKIVDCVEHACDEYDSILTGEVSKLP